MTDVECRLSPQEERDLNKFHKFFSFKVIQVIVQSRLGEKVSTVSKPNAMGYDWFNLAINDIQEVLEETKKVMGNNRLPLKDNPLCVEVSLKTNEGSTMVLETWRLGMNEKRESSNKITYTVYNRMGVLLKSLIAVSRVTPAYKISRKQGHDYILCYRIYFGQVRVAQLGENFQSVRIGAIGTPRGSITLSVAYRTKLTLAQSNSETSLSDRIRSPLSTGDDSSPHFNTITDSGMQYPVAMTAEFRLHIAQEIASAVADTDLSGSNLSPRTFKATMTSSSTSTTRSIDTTSFSTMQVVPEVQRTVVTQAPSSSASTRRRTFSETRGLSDSNSTHGAFASAPTTPVTGFPSLSSTPPFASLLSNHSTSSSKNRRVSSVIPATTRKTSGAKQHNSVNNSINSSQSNVEDDFILVELKAAFAPETSSTDLTQFYRDCQNAPPLQLFDTTPAQPLSTVMDSFSNELDVFERNMKNFDAFIKQLESNEKT